MSKPIEPDTDPDREQIGEPSVVQPAKLRESLLWRLPPEVASALPQALGPAPPATRRGETFIDLVFGEIAAIEERLNYIWGLRVSGPDVQRPQLTVIVDDWRLHARIEMKPGEERPNLKLAIGAALAFDDLALFVLCNDLALAPDLSVLAALAEDKGDYYSSLGVVGAQRETPSRFRDYEGALGDEALDADALTYAAPSAPWRLAQASLLSELMLAFVLLHERAHYALGHLDAIAHDEAETLALSESIAALGEAIATERDCMPGAAWRPVLELQADAHAYFVLCAYAFAPDGPCRRYNELIAELGDAPPAALKEMSFEAGIRLCLTAASLSCLAFQIASPPREGRSLSHPSPHARLMNMMVNTPILSPLVEQRGRGHFVLRWRDRDGGESPLFKALVENVFAMSLSDLSIAAAYFGDQLSPLKRSSTGGDVEPADWLNDLGAFWISDDPSRNTTPVTEAAEELSALRPVEAALDPMLRRLQKGRFGEETEVDVGDLLAEAPNLNAEAPHEMDAISPATSSESD